MPNNVFYSDCELLELVKAGDREAFALIYRKYWKDLYDASYYRLKDSQQAEDIVQDVFVSLWSRRFSLTIDNLPAYLHTAVRFRIFNYVERDLAGKSFYEPMEQIIASHAGADDDLLCKEMIHLIELYANSLPEKRKEIFLLHLGGNLSSREIAEKLHIKQKTVQNQLGRAFEGLKTRITGLGLLSFYCFLY